VNVFRGYWRNIRASLIGPLRYIFSPSMGIYRRFSGATRLESQIQALIYELQLSRERTDLLISEEINRLDGYINFHVHELKSEMRELAESSSLILASVSSSRVNKEAGSTGGMPNRSSEVTVEPGAMTILNEPRIGLDAIHLTSPSQV
jgi:hypothetical protein